MDLNLSKEIAKMSLELLGLLLELQLLPDCSMVRKLLSTSAMTPSTNSNW